MITTRWIEDSDYETITKSLEHDKFHQGGEADYFYEEGSCCNVYEDENGPIMFLRGCNYHDNPEAVSIDIQFMSNDDARRNMEALLFANNVWAKQCKEYGFKELVFCSKSPRLKRFCKKYLGFYEVDEIMHKAL